MVRKLHQFALAERASMVDMRQAARLTPSPERAAAYLRHADDEARHAHMFLRRAQEVARTSSLPAPGALRVDTEHLFDTLGEVAFLAFVHYGEARARRQFETYQDWFLANGRDKDHALFDAVLADERRHERYTYAFLCELSGSEAAAKAAVRRAFWWEAKRRWLRSGRTVATAIYFVCSWLLYVVLLVWVPVIRLARPALRRWQQRPNALT